MRSRRPVGGAYDDLSRFLAVDVDYGAASSCMAGDDALFWLLTVVDTLDEPDTVTVFPRTVMYSFDTDALIYVDHPDHDGPAEDASSFPRAVSDTFLRAPHAKIVVVDLVLHEGDEHHANCIIVRRDSRRFEHVEPYGNSNAGLGWGEWVMARIRPAAPGSTFTPIRSSVAALGEGWKYVHPDELITSAGPQTIAERYTSPRWPWSPADSVQATTDLDRTEIPSTCAPWAAFMAHLVVANQHVPTSDLFARVIAAHSPDTMMALLLRYTTTMERVLDMRSADHRILRRAAPLLPGEVVLVPRFVPWTGKRSTGHKETLLFPSLLTLWAIGSNLTLARVLRVRDSTVDVAHIDGTEEMLPVHAVRRTTAIRGLHMARWYRWARRLTDIETGDGGSLAGGRTKFEVLSDIYEESKGMEGMFPSVSVPSEVDAALAAVKRARGDAEVRGE